MTDTHEDRTDDDRDETSLERWDRNFGELLQELRVAQTGVQILFAFLLTLPFTNRFGDISGLEKVVYVVTLVSAATATALLIAPVSDHRQVFRQGRKPQLVQTASRLAQAGLAALLVAMIGAVFLVLDVVAGLGWAIGLGIVITLLFLTLWYLLPEVIRAKR
jgi:O-antigen/teichoic acid export membrane protein